LKPLPKRAFLSQNYGLWSLVSGCCAARPQDLSLSLGGGTGTQRRFLSRAVPRCRWRAPPSSHGSLLAVCSFLGGLFAPVLSTVHPSSLCTLCALAVVASPIRARSRFCCTSFALPLSLGWARAAAKSEFQEGVRGGRAPANRAHKYADTPPPPLSFITIAGVQHKHCCRDFSSDDFSLPHVFAALLRPPTRVLVCVRCAVCVCVCACVCMCVVCVPL